MRITCTFRQILAQSRQMPKRIYQYKSEQLFPHPAALLRVHRQPYQFTEQLHTHDFVELVLVMAGTAVHRVGSTSYQLEAGDVFVINRHHLHGYECPTSFHIVNLLIREPFFRRVAPLFADLPGYQSLFTIGAHSTKASVFDSRMRMGGADWKRVEELVNLMERESARSSQGGEAMAEAYLTLIVGILARAYGQVRMSPVPMVTRIGQLLALIEQNADQPVSLSDLSRVAMMSERSLLRKFKEATGSAPLEHLIRIRLRKACALLQAPGESVTHQEIADRCGFVTGNYFARQFKRHLGCSPSDWVKKNSEPRI